MIKALKLVAFCRCWCNFATTLQLEATPAKGAVQITTQLTFISTYKLDIDENDDEHYISDDAANDLFFYANLEMTNFLIYAPENYFLRRFEEEGQITPLGIRGEGLFKHLVEIYRNNPELLTKISEKLKLIDWFQGFEIPTDLLFTERRINIKDRFLENLSNLDSQNF